MLGNSVIIGPKNLRGARRPSLHSILHVAYSSVLKPFGLFSFDMRVLGIETSCDESAVCLIEAEGEFDKNFRFKVLGNALISQASIHAKYGGVFPNLAKREHGRNLVPLLEHVFKQAFPNPYRPTRSIYKGGTRNPIAKEIRKILAREPELYEKLIVFLQKYAKPAIDAIAVTVGPGLEPALWVGINFARALSVAWSASRRIPVVAVNHMEGHIVSALIADTAEIRRMSAENRRTSLLNPIPYTLYPISYPMLALLISGGHTELVLSKEWQKYEIVGATRDDAVGEAYDKVARLLGLPYPGGPRISALAEMSRKNADLTRKDAERIRLPRPMLHDDSFDFSFAGLKTAVRRIVESKGLTKGPTFGNSPRSDLDASDLDAFRMQIAREFEDAVADVLVAKTIRAVEEYGAQTVIVGGGVSANSYIRHRLSEALGYKLHATGYKLLFPPPELATDNALMIALAGYFRAVKSPPAGGFAVPSELRANGNLKLA